MDIENSAEAFFEYFKLKPCKITMAMRDSLESLWCHKYYEETKTIKGKEIEDWGNYELHYSADQWYRCELTKYVKSQNNTSYEVIKYGEGDTPMFALMAMSIEAASMLLPEELEGLKSIFTEDINEYNKIYEVEHESF